MDSMDTSDTGKHSETITAANAGRVLWHLLFLLQAIMAAELVALLIERQFLDGILVFGIMGATISPVVLNRRFSMGIPAGLQILAAAFVFAAFFLGELHGYYVRIWWWDVALHTGSGLLLGIVGFLLVHAMNEDTRVELTMHPRFIAFFAFTFAVACGALWEIFEFAMDQSFGMRMQKPSENDPSGLTDTMWDLIVDTLGAAAISLYGWRAMVRAEPSFIDRLIGKFARRRKGTGQN
jgi:hypothetical protein